MTAKKRTRKILATKKAPVKKRVKTGMKPVKRTTRTLTEVNETALIGALKTRILGTIGKAYANMCNAKSKREKAGFQKIIVVNKAKLKKLA